MASTNVLAISLAVTSSSARLTPITLPYADTGSHAKCLVDYGRKLRAQKIIHGRVSRVGEAYVITIKMIDVGSAAVDAIENAKVLAGVEQLVDFVPPTTCRLLRDALAGPK